MKKHWEIGLILGLFVALLFFLAASPGAGFNYEGIADARAATTPSSGIPVLARENTGPVTDTDRNPSMTATNVHGGSPFTTKVPWNLKVNLSNVDARDVLDKVAGLPITTWKYQGEERQILHMGPKGEEFNAAFHLGGTTEANYTVVDESGVALAAIQGLNQKVEQQTAELKERDARIKALEKRLDDLEKLMTSVAQH